MLTTKQAQQLERAKRLAAKGTLPDAQFQTMAATIHKMNEGRQFVRVEKMNLTPGEELWDFVTALSTAVQTNRVVMANGSLDICLSGIYDDFVIVQDFNTGKFFKSAYSRDESGEFQFGEPVEVVSQFVEVGNVQKRGGIDMILEVKKSVGGSVFSGII